MKNIPPVIYLQIGDDCDCKDFKKMVIEHGEDITWCEDSINGNDIKYIRAPKNSKVAVHSTSTNNERDVIFPPFKSCCNISMLMMDIKGTWWYWCQKCGNTTPVS